MKEYNEKQAQRKLKRTLKIGDVCIKLLGVLVVVLFVFFFCIYLITGGMVGELLTGPTLLGWILCVYVMIMFILMIIAGRKDFKADKLKKLINRHNE